MLFQRFFILATVFLFAIGSAVHAKNPVLPQDVLLQQMQGAQSPVILDVRSDKEFKKGHVEGASHIPLKQLKKQLSQLADNKQQAIVVYCQSGPRARKAIKLLRQAGFDQAIELQGNYKAWKENGLPIVVPEASAK